MNNFGFEIERKVGGLQSEVGNWNKIGFVKIIPIHLTPAHKYTVQFHIQGLH